MLSDNVPLSIRGAGRQVRKERVVSRKWGKYGARITLRMAGAELAALEERAAQRSISAAELLRGLIALFLGAGDVQGWRRLGKFGGRIQAIAPSAETQSADGNRCDLRLVLPTPSAAIAPQEVQP